ncbi:PA3371 family protein [Pseudomonas sp. 18175]|uniref:PA3371 family protein n=1 Tax=Pseudomonas sp. 18175 TaxID=3390056 RepID=UPI003D1C10CC
MTKSAWLFLCLTVATALLGLDAESQDGKTIAFVATGVFVSVFLLTLIVGRRIKFDPVLR